MRNHHKLGWFRTTEINFVIFLEASGSILVLLSQNQGVERAVLFLEAPGQHLFLAFTAVPCFSPLLVAASISWFVARSLQSQHLSSRCL